MKVLRKDILSEVQGVRVTRLEIAAADIARQAKPGQFVVVMACEEGERIPLTVVEASAQKGSITLIFQEAGLTTKLLGKLKAGDSLYALVGPLGHPTPIKNYASVIIVGGGVGIAEIYPVAKALKAAGNHIATILGARSKDLLILEKELKGVSDELQVTTDDGTYGRKGFVTDVLKELLTHDTAHDLIYAVGPIPMMRNVSSVGKASGVRTIVSLNSLMIDATGMCGVCRVTVGGEVKFTCVDGPEFDGELVDWDELVKRTRVYIDKEKHICKLRLKE